MLRAVLYKEKELRIEEAPIPEIGDDEVLVKNKVSTTCGTDVKEDIRFLRHHIHLDMSILE